MAVNPVPVREGFVAQEPPPEAPEAAAETNVQPIREVWPVTVKLVHTQPIRNHRNEMIDRLTLRAPTGADINRYGNPVRLNQDSEPVMDERKMTAMIAALSGVLQPVIETLDTRDWNSAAYRLMPFFLPEPLLAWQ